MKRLAFAMMAALAVCVCRADGPLGGEAKGSGTNRVVTSKTVTERAWRRDVVSVDDLGQIHGDGGRIAQVAETEAVNDVAERSGELADAATEAMVDSLDFLVGQTNNMARAGLGIALAFPPETDDINVRAFVVKTETQGLVDKQWVWYNRALSLPPNRTVCYERNDGTSAKVKAVWQDWDADGDEITVSGKRWSGVHVCTVTRPTWASGKACLDLPNEVWGGENGMDWGDMVLTHGSVPYFTGYVTNAVDRKVAYFDNGFLKEITNQE